MNFRVFLLIAAMGVFGAVWSSDGRYQANQVALSRAERARSQFVVTVVRFDQSKPRPAAPTANANPKPAANNGPSAAQICALLAADSAEKLLRVQPSENISNDRMTPEALLGRTLISWVLGIDPGNRVTVLTEQVDIARISIEERLCLLRFRGRQAAYYTGRRIAIYLREQLAITSRPSRMVRIIIREIPIEESQALPTGGRQTR